MSTAEKGTISIPIDAANPGQFFACCGLLELADRLWDGAEGWFGFGGTSFAIKPCQTSSSQEYTLQHLLTNVAECSLTNTMTKAQRESREHLSKLSKKQLDSDPMLKEEKKTLDKLWREAPIVLKAPFHICVDWFANEYTGGSIFKTWAGQQSACDIAQHMKEPLNTNIRHLTTDELLQKRVAGALPFNFDSDLGGIGSDLDVGFSFDPLKTIKVPARPMLEFFAFIGLQRFRPKRISFENRYQYSLWALPMLPRVAAVAASGLLETSYVKEFEFNLLYRTKYLKSFLPATTIERKKK